MRIKLAILIFQASILLVVYSCSSGKNPNNSAGNTTTGLKDHFKNNFTVGVAVSPRAIASEEASLIKTEFNSVTAENAMKMGPIHPLENQFNWRDADSIINFAKANGMRVRGHALVWHQQTPNWFFTDSKRNKVSKEVLLERLKHHITTVVQRYKGTVYAWDVVNEAISDNNSEFYRKSEFYSICGEEYIERAFEYAHAADPSALLFYSDYNEIDASKRARILKLIKDLRAKGIPVHGVGLQAHWAIGEPKRSQLDSTLSEFSQLGLPLHITELDISVYRKEHNARERRPEDSDTTFNNTRERAQLEQYKMCFDLFAKYDRAIESVTFWNVSDRHSWLDNFPVQGRKDYPLLFDRQLKRKKSYYAVIGGNR